MTKKTKIIVTIALMLGMSLAALDTTIVGTALPSIVGKLGGITLYSWVFSAYLLTSTSTVAIYGKLADLFGRKPLFLFGTAVFLIGSMASGAAQSMEQLIIFRAIQGLGAGAVLPIVLIVLFLLQEARASEPILPLTLFTNRIIAISSIGGVILGVIMFGITSYVPLFVQGVRGGTATSAGVTLGPLLLAWPIASMLSGKIILRYGYRLTACVGALLVSIGVGLVTLLQASSTLPSIVVAMLVIGTGLGLMSTAFIISVQNAVPWNVRGVTTASTQFFRTIGGTVGVALIGTILNLQMAARFAPILARYPAVVAHLPKNIAPSNVLLTPNVRQSLPVDFLNQLQTALAQSLFWVYALMFALAVIGLATMFFFPGGRPEQYSYKAEAEDDTQTETIEPEPHVTTIG